MKTIKTTLFAFLAIATFTLQSCSKDDSGDDSSATYIRFTIDNTEYDFKDIITAESLSITLNGNNGEGIANPGDTQITIWLPLEPVVGTVEIDNGFGGINKVSFSSESMGFVFDFAESGSITITKISNDFIEGTFTATITSESDTTINITNGKFKAEMF